MLVATCVSSLGSFYTMSVTSFALPQIQRGLSIPEDEVGSLFALLRSGTIFSLVLAVAADRLGRRRLLVASVAGCALCNVATAFSRSGLEFAWLQLGARFFLGAQILLAVVVVTEELSADNRGWGLGVLSAVGGMGGALTLLVYMFVEYLPYGWRFLYVVGGLGLLCVPWLWGSLQETRRFSEHQSQTAANAASGPAWQPLRDIVRLHGWRLAALVGVMIPVSVILEPGIVFVSKHLQDEMGYSPGQVGLLVGGCGVMTPLGNLVSGAVSDRFGRKPVAAFVSLLLPAAVALFYNASAAPAMGLGLALLFLSIGGLIVLHGAIATELFPTAFRSTASGMREALGTVGASLGLWIVSLLYVATGSHAVSITWVLLLAPISPLVILFLVPETARRELEEIAPDEVGA
ncbi:MAG: MFS transporter [Deltaproteobacteria bacterium]|nr:MFS transporter [Deltaproteobacteria bacterium]MBW2419139.1 MFS transporter [Deltaproteobacteria bacterium]